MQQLEDVFATAYYLMCSYFSASQYNCREVLQEVFEKNRVMYNLYRSQKPTVEMSKDKYFQIFAIFLIRLAQIVFTKISFEELS